jgi:putative tricarboxylic transport membrane protein
MAEGVSSRRGEAIVTLVLLALALYIVWTARGMPAGTVALPGPGFFPVAVGTLLALVSVGILIRLARQPEDGVRVPLGHRDIAVALAALFAVAMVFEPLGAIATLGLLLFVLIAAFARIALWRAALCAVGGAALAWLVFIYLLGVQLPRGVF